jgi:hypothetical protein
MFIFTWGFSGIRIGGQLPSENIKNVTNVKDRSLSFE